MASKLSHGKDINTYTDDEIDDLLNKLTPEEIEELNNDIDPDNHLLPASQRCRDQTTKQATGSFDRDALIRFIEEKSKQEKDWEKNTPFEKKTRGKIFKAKMDESEISKKDLEDMGFDVEFDTEFDEALRNATEEELVDLAAVLGFNGMLNQTQYHASLENKDQMCGGFQGVAKCEPCRPIEDEPDNDIDVESTIKKLSADDPSLTEVNMNNLSDITDDIIKRLCEAVIGNKHLTNLSCANIHLNNTACDNFVKLLEQNDHLSVLNLESNFLSGDTILKLLTAINREKSGLTELHIVNQQQKVLGVRVEQEITRLVKENATLQILGINLETAEARIRIRDHLTDNIDRKTRQNRLQKKN